MPPKKAVKKKKNGYQMPEQFQLGFVLKDVFKKSWCLGKPIGQGGFGLIYIATKGEVLEKNPESGDYVVKIEPKENGPLFCETHFYTNCAKKDELEKFISAKKLTHLAMPKYISSGTCVYNEKDYRFLVMDRYTTDLQRILLKPEVNHQVSSIGVLCLMRQILWALEYIHNRGYAHGDIKGANLMLKKDDECYLVDYGLAYRFKRDNIHQKYEIKPDRRHNGTIEYTSRDAHDGAQISRRSDLEILGYCAIHWTSSKLPWIELIKNPVHVQESKKKSMANLKEFFKSTLEAANVPTAFVNFMNFYMSEVNKLEFDSEPDYVKIHNKITETLGTLGHSKTSKDNFYVFNSQAKETKSVKKSAKPAKEIILDETETKPVKTKTKKRENVNLNESSSSESDLPVKDINSKKKTRTMPKMFDDTIDESQSKTSLIKQQKKTNSLIQSPKVVNSPRRETPKRAAKRDSAEKYYDETENVKENKKENIIVNTFTKLDEIASPRQPKLIKKVKNKNSRTISTQTENSYLQNIRNKMRLS